MLPAPLLALALAAGPLACPAGPLLPVGVAPRAVPADSLALLYTRGVPWTAFLEKVEARRATWLENYEGARVDAALVDRANAVPGRWHFLVVAEDWCGDSANTIPYLARLVESAERLELRIVNSEQGRWVMEAHRTEDGRAATPTVVLLDEAGQERACWVERPMALRAVVAEVRAGTRSGSVQEAIVAWRRQDQGQSTLADLVELLEAAAAGHGRCP